MKCNFEQLINNKYFIIVYVVMLCNFIYCCKTSNEFIEINEFSIEIPSNIPSRKELVCFLDTVTMQDPMYIITRNNWYVIDSSYLHLPIADIDSFINNHPIYYLSDEYLFGLRSVMIRNIYRSFTGINYENLKKYPDYSVGYIRGTKKFAIYLFNIAYFNDLWQREVWDAFEYIPAVSSPNEYVKLAFPIR